jgi:PAS domain S-box-containing protein
LAEETERLAVTLKSIGDGVITTDTQGRVVLINKIAETLTGWDSHEATGQRLADVFTIINEVTRQPCESPVEKVLASGKIIGLANHTALISKNGQERSIAGSGAPIRDKIGNIIGVVLVFRDITDQLRTEKELIKIKKLESIGVLAGGIAHDFNNILVAILGNIDLSLRDANLTDKTRELLKQAIKASYQARDLTRQLLTFAKGGQPIKEAASLAEVIKDSADFILRGDKVACRYFIPDDLWLVDIDKGQISQVVQNIILNASNAMPAGGTIEVSCENVSAALSSGIALPTAGNCVKMSITDNGVGIPENVLDKIFDPYFSTKKQGSGLGLAITHSIVSKHDGHISVKSTPGMGTTFAVYLPASSQRHLAVEKKEATDWPTKKARILVMDDEELVRNILEAMLHQMGHEVLLVKDGMEALQTYREAVDNGTPIDLIIMDLTIPGGMGGKEAVQKILSIDPAANAIVSSGYSNDPVIANFKDYGFCSAIVKPYQFAELKKTIDHLTK